MQFCHGWLQVQLIHAFWRKKKLLHEIGISATFLSSGPTNFMLLPYQVNNCILTYNYIVNTYNHWGILLNHHFWFVGPGEKAMMYCIQCKKIFFNQLSQLSMFFIDLQVARICDEIPKLSIKGLKDCNLTWDDCVTYSRNRRYSYKCNTTMLFKDKLGKGVVVYLRVDVTWIHIMIKIRHYKFIWYFLHRATVV